MYNGVASIAVGAYLLAVAVNGNSDKLFAALKEEGGYVQWFFAFLILLALAENENTKEVGRPLIAIAFAAMLITASKNQTLWSGVQSLIDLFNPNRSKAA
jgi:hypothetical protein